MHQKLRKLHFFLSVALVSSLTFSIDSFRITSFLVVLLSANALALYLTNREIGHSRERKVVLGLSVIFYLIHVFGLITTANMDQGFFELEKKLALLLFPLIMFFTPPFEPAEIRNVLKFFVFSCAASLTVCLLAATRSFMDTGDTQSFFYHTLSEPVGMHAAYLSMYFCFAIAILLWWDGAVSRPQFGLWRILAILFLGLGILLLSARAQVMILCSGIAIWLFMILKRNYGFGKAVPFATLLGVVMLGIALLFPVNRDRFMRAINYEQRYGLDREWGEQQIRTLIWSCSLDVIEANPLLGVGTGDGEDELQECYRENKFVSLTYFEGTTFNAHNQVLETTIQLGIFGALIFLAGIFYSCKCAYRDNNTLFLAMTFIFLVSCMTESMLESQSGIIFFAFFGTFLFFNKLEIGIPNQQTSQV